jgi:hypothetical protein
MFRGCHMLMVVRRLHCESSEVDEITKSWNF